MERHIEEKIVILEEYEANADDWYVKCLSSLETACLDGANLDELLALTETMRKIEFLGRCLGDIRKAAQDEAERRGIRTSRLE